MDSSSAQNRLDTALAKRLHQALMAGAEDLYTLLRDPSDDVVRAVLRNPSLTEDHLLVLLKRRDLTEQTLKAVHNLEREKPSHKLKVALVQNCNIPGHIMRSLLPHLFLFELLNLCFLPGATPDQKLAAERIIIQRLPDIPLGNRITLARRGTSNLVGELLKEGQAVLMEPCLANPRLKEVSVLQFLHSSRPTPETISVIARHPKWQHRPNLQLAILKHRKTPAVWYPVLLPRLKRTDLQTLLASRQLLPSHRPLVAQELLRRGKGLTRPY